MTAAHLLAALLAILLGSWYCIRQSQPLFFKILLFACASEFLGALAESCWLLVFGVAPTGFHVGYLGYMGAWFFLVSSYFGAIDRLADGGEDIYRPYRLIALLAPAIVFGLTSWSLARYGVAACLPLLLLALPLGLTCYFALKHLLLPDVELGIIRVLRPYNACLITLSLCETLTLLPDMPGGVITAARGLFCLLLAAMLPIANQGVRKWFI